MAGGRTCSRGWRGRRRRRGGGGAQHGAVVEGDRQRVALAREAAGLPPLKDYVVEPTKVFDNMWYFGLASQGAFVITAANNSPVVYSGIGRRSDEFAVVRAGLNYKF